MKSILMFVCVITSGIGLALGWVPPLFAQEEFTLDEITVTAQKREQALQDTAMSIQVVDGDDLRAIGALDFFNMLKNVTTVTMVEAGGEGVIAIRGIGLEAQSFIADPTVGVTVDGAAQTSSDIMRFGNFDIERVEVLRGPQGTLYGRNATAGVVNIIGNKPKMGVIEGYVNFELADYEKMTGTTAINVPISDHFAGRLSMIYTGQDSYLELRDGYRSRDQGLAARMQIRYEPSDEAYVNLLTHYTKSLRVGPPFQNEVFVSDWNKGIVIDNKNDPSYARTSVTRNESLRLVLDAEHTLGPGIVNLIPSYEHRTRMDTAGLSTNMVTGAIDWSKGVVLGDAIPQKSYSLEGRYSSKPESRVTWVAGIFYLKDDMPGSSETREYTYKAVFGQMTYPLSDTYRLVAGLRQEKDNKFLDFVGGSTPFGTLPPFAGNREFNYTDWKVGVEKDFRDDVMGYFTLATAHRGGGINITGNLFDTESSISGEAGVKSRWLDQRLQVNADIYYNDYKNYQLTDMWIDNDPVTGAPQMMQLYYNCDKVVLYGSEIDVDLLVGRATKINASIAYLHGTYEADYILHLTPDPSSVINAKGDDIPHSPRFTINAGINHRFMLSNGAYLTPRLSAKYTGRQYVGHVPTPESVQDGYTVVDFSLNFQATKDWSLNFYGTNILNKKYFTGINGPRTAIFPGYPRMVGCTFEIRF